MTGYVYLIHFDRPISPGRPCQHYLGYADNLASRLHEHRTGGSKAARLLQVAKERGIGWHVAIAWHGGRAFESQLKRGNNSPR